MYDVIPDIQRTDFYKNKFSPTVLFTDGKIPGARGRFQKLDELNDFFSSQMSETDILPFILGI
jgi:DNA (cytosine-5)-methyltransferase 1